MKEKDLNEKIRTAVNHSVPDVFDSILSRLEEQKGQVIQVNLKQAKPSKRRSWMKLYGMIAAVFAMFVVGIASYNFYEQRAVDSIISLDVNPSIEMKVNKNEKVLEVQPLNEDGQIIIGEMDFNNTDLEIAVNALIGSMLKNGYISEIKNAILISVENKDEAKRAALQAKLAEEIDRLLRANSIDGAIVSQSITDDDQLKTLADEHTITSGKAQVIKQLVDMDPRYQFAELAKLSINELNLLVESKHVELANASAVGTVSDKAYIGKDNAVQAAMSHAGVDASTARDLKVELDYDDGKMVYEVEFDAGGMEYEYEIDAVSGVILSYEMERDDDDGPTTSPKTEQPTLAPSKSEQPAASRMSAATARKAVLARFGGMIQKIEYNYDDRNPLYKGEALKSGNKVVFELNARTQSFEKWDVGNDNDWDEFSHALSDMITMDEAANIVTRKSGKSDTFVQKIDFLWDDSEPMYQGEAFNRGVKYSFEIYAYGGKFHKWDADTGDETWADEYFNVR